MFSALFKANVLFPFKTNCVNAIYISSCVVDEKFNKKNDKCHVDNQTDKRSHYPDSI